MILGTASNEIMALHLYALAKAEIKSDNWYLPEQVLYKEAETKMESIRTDKIPIKENT